MPERVEGPRAMNFRVKLASSSYLMEYGTEHPRMRMPSVAKILDGEHFNTSSLVGHRESPQDNLPYWQCQSMFHRRDLQSVSPQPPIQLTIVGRPASIKLQ